VREDIEFENHFKNSLFYCTFVLNNSVELLIQPTMNIPVTGDIMERSYETGDFEAWQYEL